MTHMQQPKAHGNLVLPLASSPGMAGTIRGVRRDGFRGALVHMQVEIIDETDEWLDNTQNVSKVVLGWKHTRLPWIVIQDHYAGRHRLDASWDST